MAPENSVVPVRDIVVEMDRKLDRNMEKIDRIMEKLDGKADRQRVHNLADMTATHALLLKLLEPVPARLESLELWRSWITGALAAVAVLASAAAVLELERLVR